MNFDLIKQEIPLHQVCASYGLELKRSSKERLVACCPFHADKNPSFTVFPDGHYYCFGCKQRGTILDFVALKEHCDIFEAGRKLYQTFAPNLLNDDDDAITEAIKRRKERENKNAAKEKEALSIVVHRLCERLKSEGDYNVAQSYESALVNDLWSCDELYSCLFANNELEAANQILHTYHPEYAPSNAPKTFAAKTADEFGENKIEYVWYPYIPKGDYTAQIAAGGTGKTMVNCGIAAAVSNGTKLPGDDTEREPATVLFISAEDRGELLKQRLKASGANLKNVFILDCMDSCGLNFTDDYDSFEELLKRYSPQLVIIDPWHAFAGANVDINRVNVVRPIFQKLAVLAKTIGCGMILVSHVNKRSQGENINHAASGSVDFINAARSALQVIFSEAPEEEDMRILVHTKSNYSAAGESIKFRITEDSGCEWAGFSNITRRTLEEAARKRKSILETLGHEEEDETVTSALLEALREISTEDRPKNISYDEMKDVYGKFIFGSRQPMKAIEIARGILAGEGYTITTKKRVKYQQKTRNGFSISYTSPQINREEGETT